MFFIDRCFTCNFRSALLQQCYKQLFKDTQKSIDFSKCEVTFRNFSIF